MSQNASNVVHLIDRDPRVKWWSGLVRCLYCGARFALVRPWNPEMLLPADRLFGSPTRLKGDCDCGPDRILNVETNPPIGSSKRVVGV